VLEELGWDAYRAREIADAFRRHNINVLQTQLQVFEDETKLMSAAKAGREELEENFAQDRIKFEKEFGARNGD